jgi:hypothetical protein
MFAGRQIWKLWRHDKRYTDEDICMGVARLAKV